MNGTEQNLIQQYAWLIPNHPVPLCAVIEQLTQKFHATQVKHDQIPHRRMHLFNAIHLPKNEELQLTEDQLDLNALKIQIDPKTEAYVMRDFVPISSDPEGENYIYLAYEPQVEYRYSNSNRLFLETKLMQGIKQSDLDQRTEDGLDFIFYLKTYDKLYSGTGNAD